MPTFDEPEFARWATAARDELDAARHNADGAFHNVAVLHAEQAAQCALKALLHGVGAGEQAYGHGLLRLAERAEHHGGLASNERDREDLERLAREYLPSRYPDALPEGTPRASYGAGSAAAAISTAERTIDRVASAWQRLVRAAAEKDDDGDAG